MEHGPSCGVDVCNVAVLMVLSADKWRCGGEVVCSELVYCKLCWFAAVLLSSKPKAKQISLS
jgi:hypothetical protein